VGDGANDVAMIQRAHLGVGIRGKEGTQAVQASDYAVSQFRFLVPLLMNHGRDGYRRISIFLCYYFYKNIVTVMPDIMWTNFNGYSGQIFFGEWITVAFNAIFTSFPCIFVFAMDEDVPADIAIKNPHLYLAGPKNKFFSAKLFWGWIITALWHGAVCYVVNMAALIPPDGAGISMGYWKPSLNAFSCVIFIVVLKLVLIGYRWTPIAVLVNLTCVILYFAEVLTFAEFGLGHVYQPQILGMMPYLMADMNSIVAGFCTCIVALLPDLTYAVVQRWFFPTPVDRFVYKCRSGSSDKTARVVPVSA
jgi:magnesium-transporting ATPase (P-type)